MVSTQIDSSLIIAYDPSFDALSDSDTDDLFSGENEEELSLELKSFTNDSALSEALNKNINLTEYSTVLDSQLADSEKACVEAYSDKSASLGKLQENIEDCDNILAGMQEMLLGFQADLGGISDEIKHLQEESMTMGVKLRNRRSAEEVSWSAGQRATLLFWRHVQMHLLLLLWTQTIFLFFFTSSPTLTPTAPES